MKLYLVRKTDNLNIDDEFLVSYDVKSIVPENVEVISWDTVGHTGLIFFNEFAKVDGVMPGPEEFTTLSEEYSTALDFAVNSRIASQNPVHYWRYVDEVNEEFPDFGGRVGDVYVDDTYPPLGAPPEGFIDIEPPGVVTVGLQKYVPSVIMGDRSGLGRYLQWSENYNKFVVAAYDVTKTLDNAKAEIITKLKKKLADDVNNELSIYSQVELIQSSDINSLPPAYSSEPTIGDYIAAVKAAVDQKITDINSINTHEALREIDPSN